jgi:hypothetical protein
MKLFKGRGKLQKFWNVCPSSSTEAGNYYLMLVFCVVLHVDTNVSEELTTSIFGAETFISTYRFTA